MPAKIDDAHRLQILNEAQPRRPWHSCAEKRHCLACQRNFRGSSVRIRRTSGLEPGCPHCGNGPQFWVLPGNPLLEDHVWEDWQLAMSAAESCEDQDDQAAVG